MYTIDFKLYCHSRKGIPFEGILNIVTTFGGALGTFIAYFVWDRKLTKENMMSRIVPKQKVNILIVIILYWALKRLSRSRTCCGSNERVT